MCSSRSDQHLMASIALPIMVYTIFIYTHYVAYTDKVVRIWANHMYCKNLTMTMNHTSNFMSVYECTQQEESKVACQMHTQRNVSGSMQGDDAYIFFLTTI